MISPPPSVVRQLQHSKADAPLACKIWPMTQAVFNALEIRYRMQWKKVVAARDKLVWRPHRGYVISYLGRCSCVAKRRPYNSPGRSQGELRRALA